MEKKFGSCFRHTKTAYQTPPQIGVKTGVKNRGGKKVLPALVRKVRHYFGTPTREKFGTTLAHPSEKSSALFWPKLEKGRYHFRPTQAGTGRGPVPFWPHRAKKGMRRHFAPPMGGGLWHSFGPHCLIVLGLLFLGVLSGLFWGLFLQWFNC